MNRLILRLRGSSTLHVQLSRLWRTRRVRLDRYLLWGLLLTLLSRMKKMKWLNRLSHRFWLWVDRRIEHHKFLEGITGEYPFMVEPNVSVKITSEEIEAKKQA